MKTQFVMDLGEGTQVDELFICRRKRLSTDRNGRAFLALLLGDRSGEVEALMWSHVETATGLFEVGDTLRVTGKVSAYQGRLQLHVTGLRRAEAEEGPAERLIPVAHVDPGDQWEALFELLQEVAHPALQSLVAHYKQDPDFREAFLAAPAASSHHHAHPGGLVQHTLSVVRLTRALCEHYEDELAGLLDRDICLVGAFLHDLGKVWELRVEGGAIIYTDEGRLEGHLVIGVRDLDRRVARLDGFPPPLAMALRHVMISHHGKLEFGSPKEPMTAEALVVHAADKLDSELAAVQRILAQPRSGPWSGPQAPFHRFFYKG